MSLPATAVALERAVKLESTFVVTDETTVVVYVPDDIENAKRFKIYESYRHAYVAGLEKDGEMKLRVIFGAPPVLPGNSRRAVDVEGSTVTLAKGCFQAVNWSMA